MEFILLFILLTVLAALTCIYAANNDKPMRAAFAGMMISAVGLVIAILAN